MFPAFGHVPVLWVAAVVWGLGAGVIVARRQRLPPGRALLAALALAVAVFAGAKLHYLLATVPFTASGLSWRSILGPGIHFPGGLLAATLLSPLICRGLGLPLGRLGDALVPVIGVAYAIARLGCFSVGCCYGAPTPWGISFAPGTGVFWVHVDREWITSDAPGSLPVHPTQLYFAALGLVIAAAGLTWRRYQRRDAETILLAIALWGYGKAVVEQFRDPEALAGSPHLALSGLCVALVASALFVNLRYGWWSARRMEAASPPTDERLPKTGSVP